MDFSYKKIQEQTVPNILASLIHQLTFREISLRSKLALLCEAHQSQRTRPSIDDYTVLLQEIVGHRPKIYLLMDALDELPLEPSTLLAVLCRLKPKVSSLFTFRDLPGIQVYLSHACRLDIQAKDQDIKNYVQKHIGDFERIKLNAEKDPDLYSIIATTIAAKAEGM